MIEPPNILKYKNFIISFFRSSLKHHHLLYKLFIFLIALLIFSNINALARPIKSLKNKKIKSAEIIVDKETTKIPGSSFPIGIKVILETDDTLQTRGLLNGTLRWNNFNLEILGGLSKHGKVQVYGDNDLVDKDFIIIVVRSKHDSNLLLRTRVELNYLTGIEIFPLNKFAYAPGNRISLGLIKKYDNGDFQTVSKARQVGQELDDYDIYVNGGQYGSATFKISDDIFTIVNHLVGIQIVNKRNPDLQYIYEIQLNYIDDYYFARSGWSGSNGMSGFSGSSGSDGLEGRRGENGRDGENGEYGRHGGDGPDIEVYADAYFDSILNYDLLKLMVTNLDNGEIKYYLLNPQGGRIFISSDGGDGGKGGSGGNGGIGGNGGDGKKTEKIVTKTITYEVEVPNESKGDSVENPGTHREIRTKEVTETIIEIGRGGNGGDGGYGGHGGDGGDGGYGGNIYLYLSPAANQYMYAIKPDSDGGSGGMGGAEGYGGSGGRGGTGNPSGHGGNAGYSGTRGLRGNDGHSGEIIVYDWDGKLEF